MRQKKNSAWLWCVAIVSVGIWLALFLLLNPEELSYQLQRYRAMALVGAMLVSGFCVIIATRDRWFGHNL